MVSKMRILVVGPTYVGDMVMSHTLYRCIKMVHPSAIIDVLAPEWCRPLLARMDEVNSSILQPIGHGEVRIRERYAIGVGLRSRGYQQAIVVFKSFKISLIPFFAKIPQRTGWLGELRYGLLNDIRRLDRARLPLAVQQYAALAFPKKQMGFVERLPDSLWPELTPSAEEIAETSLIFSMPPAKQTIALCPGQATGLAKSWPHYHHATLARELIDRGYWVVLFGTAKDRPICEAIEGLIPRSERGRCLNLAGKSNLTQIVPLLAACRAVVSNDSGLLHISAALKRPLIALYGPSSPTFAPPLCRQARVIKLPEADYQGQTTGGREGQGYHPSLINIQPSTVYKELSSLLDGCGNSCAYPVN